MKARAFHHFIENSELRLIAGNAHHQEVLAIFVGNESLPFNVKLSFLIYLNACPRQYSGFCSQLAKFNEYMKFPDSPRTSYGRNPLTEVICQLRFPRILRIENEVPVDFQEAVRGSYPLLNTSRVLPLPLLVNPQPNPPPVILDQGLTYEFLNKEQNQKLVLSSDFIALTTTKYTHWEEFRESLSTAIDVLVQCYAPSHFIRVGLRYQDLVLRSELGLQNCSWRELLKPPILGIFATEDLLEQDFVEALSLFAYSLDNPGAVVRVQHGLGRKNGFPEFGYLIDADFYTEGLTEIKDVITHLNFFNREAGKFFRWCITDKLHQVLEPRPIT